MSNSFAIALAEALLASTLLLGLVLLLRRPVARHFGAHAAYALWALPALRLLLPPLPGWSNPLATLASRLPSLSAPLSTASDGAGTIAPVPAPMVSAVAATPQWPHWLALVWIAGVILAIVYQVWRYQQFLGTALTNATLLQRSETADVLMSAAVAGPLATGIRHPRIFIPTDFHSRFDPSERDLALRHEHAHHRRGDIIANVAGLAVLALHWWNPIAHIAWRAFRADQELACDATVLAGATGADRQSYGRAMLKSAAAPVPTAACAMNAKTQLKERITMMKHHDHPLGRRAWGLAGTAALVLGGLAVTAAGAPPAPAAAPVAPEPPAPAAVVAPPAPTAPPAPRAAPAPPTRQVRTLIIKDGKVIENSNGSSAVIVAPGDSKAEAKTGTPHQRIMLIRQGDGPNDADIDAIIHEATTDATNKVMKKVIITCAPGGDKGADKGADKGCGAVNLASINPSIRESLTAARKSIETSAGLSDEQRRSALEGLDEAMREMEGDAGIKPPAR